MTRTADKKYSLFFSPSLDTFVDVSFFLMLFSLYTNIFLNISADFGNYFYYFSFFSFVSLTFFKLIFRIRLKGTVILPHITIWYGLFILLGFASVLWAYQPSASFHVLSRMVQCLVIQFCMVQNFSTKETLPRCLKLIVLAAVISSAYILIRTPFSQWFNSPFGSAVTDLNPNTLGGIYSLAAVIAYFFAYHLRKKKAYLAAVYLLAVVILTGSRKSMLAVLLGILILTVTDSKRKHLIFRLITILFVIAFVFYLIMTVPELYSAIGRRFDSMLTFINKKEGDHSIALRLAFIDIARKIFLENFLFGIGLFNFSAKLGSIMNITTYAHNNYYELLADLGLTGFLLYYSYYVYVAIATLKRAVHGSQYAKLMLTIILIILFCDFGIVSFYSAQTNIFFACTSIFLSVCDYPQKNMPKAKP